MPVVLSLPPLLLGYLSWLFLHALRFTFGMTVSCLPAVGWGDEGGRCTCAALSSLGQRTSLKVGSTCGYTCQTFTPPPQKKNIQKEEQEKIWFAFPFVLMFKCNVQLYL